MIKTIRTICLLFIIATVRDASAQLIPGAADALTYTPYTFSTFAGSNSTPPGYQDGIGTSAVFSAANQGIAVDGAGNIYVADTENYVIRKITPAGAVSTLAGSAGAYGDVDGQGAVARFSSNISGLAVDASGNVYVADTINVAIRKITPGGLVTTLAGGASTNFHNIEGVAVDSSGNVYVADSLAFVIWKITPAGVTTQFAGTNGVQGHLDGTGTAAQFGGPYGLAVDGEGNVYVSDNSYGGEGQTPLVFGAIRKISPSGAVSTLAGGATYPDDGSYAGSTDGTGSAARISSPMGLAVDGSGNVAFVDVVLIRRVTQSGTVTTLGGTLIGTPAGDPDYPNIDGTGPAAQFEAPWGVAFGLAGEIYVTNGGSREGGIAASGATVRKGIFANLTQPSVSVSPQLPSGPVRNGSSSIVLTASATGGQVSYQWELSGVPIAGATGATETVSSTAASAGDYSVVVTNSLGSASADAGTLSISTDSWLVNLSARAYAETGANLIIAGFVTTGPDMKSLLIRGIGPTLGTFNVTGFLADPKLTLLNQAGTALASATSWSTTLDATFANVGAFALTSGSHDTALLETLTAGPYTAQVVSATSNQGVALAEIYDADNLAPTDRLVNISARAFVGTGGNILIGGFVISGNTPQTVVIRADGPALTGFNLAGALANTTLTIFDNSGNIIASNSGWGNAPTTGSGATGAMVIQPLTAALSNKVGAFTLPAGSADSGLVATLPPGPYTAQITGGSNSSGIALIEIYELR